MSVEINQSIAELVEEVLRKGGFDSRLDHYLGSLHGDEAEATAAQAECEQWRDAAALLRPIAEAVHEVLRHTDLKAAKAPINKQRALPWPTRHTPQACWVGIFDFDPPMPSIDESKTFSPRVIGLTIDPGNLDLNQVFMVFPGTPAHKLHTGSYLVPYFERNGRGRVCKFSFPLSEEQVLDEAFGLVEPERYGGIFDRNSPIEKTPFYNTPEKPFEKLLDWLTKVPDSLRSLIK